MVEVKTWKKILMGGKGYIHLSQQSKEQVEQLGYFRSDLVSVFLTGEIKEIAYQNARVHWKIIGKDTSSNPMIIMVRKENQNGYTIMSVLPFMDQDRFNECV
jgi:hypothetical protein